MKDGVKVIHLVRDPRGMLRSRQPFAEQDTQNSTQEYCDQHLKDLEYIRGLSDVYPHQMQSSIHIIRYEDLAINPMSNLQRIYKFLGVDPDGHVTAWVKEVERNNTNIAPIIPDSGRRSALNALQQGERIKSSNRHNPAFTAQAWRKTLSLEDVSSLQNVCSRFLHEFGYNLFSDIDTLRDIDTFPTMRNMIFF